MSGDHPDRRSTVAARISQRHCTSRPSSIDVRYSHECGLTKSTLVITPRISTSFERSKVPNPWCAAAGPATVMPKTVNRIGRIEGTIEIFPAATVQLELKE